jgi:hypothetical protein
MSAGVVTRQPEPCTLEPSRCCQGQFGRRDCAETATLLKGPLRQEGNGASASLTRATDQATRDGERSRRELHDRPERCTCSHQARTGYPRPSASPAARAAARCRPGLGTAEAVAEDGDVVRYRPIRFVRSRPPASNGGAGGSLGLAARHSNIAGTNIVHATHLADGAL